MTQVSISRAFALARDAWLGELRSACLTMSEKPAYLVGAISITHRFPDVTQGEREQLNLLAGNLAGEYGLSAEVNENGAWLSARLSRTAPSQTQDEAPSEGSDTSPSRTRGFVAKLLDLVRPNARSSAPDRQVTRVPDGTESEEAEESMVVS